MKRLTVVYDTSDAPEWFFQSERDGDVNGMLEYIVGLWPESITLTSHETDKAWS